jgi:hypothetical protein
MWQKNKNGPHCSISGKKPEIDDTERSNKDVEVVLRGLPSFFADGTVILRCHGHVKSYHKVDTLVFHSE